MADIDVVKKGSRTWLWIVIALAIVVALFFMMRGGQRQGQGSRTGSLLNQGGQPLAAALHRVPLA
jgi:hypothetical protein